MLIKIKDIKAVSYAMAGKTEIRYYLHGMLLETDGQRARLVATDGHRLHAVRFEIDGGAEVAPGRYILPADFVRQICKAKRISKDIAHMVDISISADGGVGAKFLDDTSMHAKLVDGRFPDYTRVIPPEVSGIVAALNPEYVLDAQAGARDYTETKNPFYVPTPNGDSAAVLNLGDFVAIIMPMREGVFPAPDSAWREACIPVKQPAQEGEA